MWTRARWPRRRALASGGGTRRTTRGYGRCSARATGLTSGAPAISYARWSSPSEASVGSTRPFCGRSSRPRRRRRRTLSPRLRFRRRRRGVGVGAKTRFISRCRCFPFGTTRRWISVTKVVRIENANYMSKIQFFFFLFLLILGFLFQFLCSLLIPMDIVFAWELVFLFSFLFPKEHENFLAIRK